MKVGTRESALAMRQTDIFREKLRAIRPDVEVEVVGMKALGDIDLTSPLSQMSNVGAFVRELDDAMIRGAIDASVNSLKDIPTKMDPRLTIPAVFERDAVEDVILPCPLEELPEGARVGTSSIRRERLLKEARPDLEIVPLRGNIHTRMDKLDAGKYDAILLAKAGLDRMGIDRPMYKLDRKVFIPAPAQGTIAVECRSDDDANGEILRKLDHMPSRIAVEAERDIMRLMGAGCSAPVGINAVTVGNDISIHAVSFDYTPEPRRVDVRLPVGYTQEEASAIADYLIGKTETIA
ncbi:MAG: hydroxymethylbilane synthase [Thermoplasmata archaeon]|nr:hydroxymethylbilane synthase [Thermoplasmata archaeon]